MKIAAGVLDLGENRCRDTTNVFNVVQCPYGYVPMTQQEAATSCSSKKIDCPIGRNG